jgi:ATP-dependent protease ClpP protease subunit
MRKLPSSFTMRKDGVLPRGDWFNFVNEGDTTKVYIYDEIGFWGTDASEFVKEINKISDPSFELHLNSPGGEVFDGLAIYNSLKQHKSDVHVFVDGLAASAASFIAQAGTTVTMARNAQLMIHDGIALAFGNEQDMLDTAAILSNLSNNIADIYAYSARQRGLDSSTEDFRSLMKQEVWYNANEAVDAGLADTVLDQEDDKLEEAKNIWDLSFYNHAGREQAESPLRVQEKIRLANRQKEKDMGDQPTNETVDPDVTPAPVPDDTPPAEPEPDAPETDEPEPAADPEPETSNIVAQGVMIGNRMVTDFSVINRHMETLQAAQNEQQAAHRKNFVEGLASDNKIPATMIDSLIDFVNGNGTKPGLSDEQFADFQASYESSASSSLFDNHGATRTDDSTTPGGAPITDAKAKADRIEILEGIISMHKRTMSSEDVEQTPSYKELQSLQLHNNES